MLFETSLIKSYLFTTVKKVHSFKVFKRSTKFKRYNKGITKFIMNRKKYFLRKRATSFIGKTLVPLKWSFYFSKKRQLIRFFQNFYILNYTMSVPTSALALKSYDYLYSSSNALFKKNFKINMAFIAKRILFNNSLFLSKFFSYIKVFFKNTKFGIVLTNNSLITSTILTSGNNIFYKSCTPPTLINIKGAHFLPKANLNHGILSFTILMVREIRKILSLLLLLNLKR